MCKFAVILPAAGRSMRFGGKNKLLELLAGVPVMVRALRPFLARADVVRLAIPTAEPSALEAVLRPWCASARGEIDPRIDICAGGNCRAESVHRALQRIPHDVKYVAVHDAARPLISAELIHSAFTAARVHGSAVPAMPAALTIKQAQGPLPAKVQQTLPRHQLWTMQTPQVLGRKALLEAFATCAVPLEQVTDDAQLLELAGRDTWLIPGEERNIKITTALDLKIAEMLV